MTLRKNIKLLLITSAAIAIVIVGFRLYRNDQEQKRQMLLKTIVENLDDYKSTHGRYPMDLSNSIAQHADWLYYSVDSVGQQFYLSYSSGFMNFNTYRYSSASKKWEESFNY